MSIGIDATIQARFASTRLPGKVLLPVAGRPLLAHIIDRIRCSRLIDRVIVATSESAQDDATAELAAAMAVPCFRGSEDDVLGRVVGALMAFNVEVHVEFQGDNALPDAALIDSVIGFYLKHRGVCDYVSTGMRTTFPPGSEVAVYDAATLIRAEAAALPEHPREHVGLHIYGRPDLFRCQNLAAPPWLHEPDMHFEVDTPEDYIVVRRVFEHFLPASQGFSLADAIRFARDSGVCEATRDVPRRWRRYRDDDIQAK